ncbi:MAG: divalent-cation tolerance protein CutA [Calditrichia bacterium]|jgi:periplasmic divalent cation tolerance protein|nr:divalent-cation tolerance protein CutA [Calditrichia bacterium]
MKESILLVYCTVSNQDEAKTIAHTLIEKSLAACCNIIPAVNSIYCWKGDVEEANESLMLIKTTQKKYEQLEKEIKMIHSYSVPEIIATKLETGSSAYIDWIIECLDKQGGEI